MTDRLLDFDSGPEKSFFRDTAVIKFRSETGTFHFDSIIHLYNFEFDTYGKLLKLRAGFDWIRTWNDLEGGMRIEQE
jgi:hypothetical protein